MEDVGNDNLFYSRRIGRRPQGSTYNYYGYNDTLEGYSNSPIRTSILGAAKLTGKTQNGLSVGFMDAVTAEEMAEIDTGVNKGHFRQWNLLLITCASKTSERL